MKLERYEALKATVERARRKHEQAVGAHELLMARLQREFGCDSLAAARALLRKRKKAAAAANEEFSREFARFSRRWEGFVRDND